VSASSVLSALPAATQPGSGTSAATGGRRRLLVSSALACTDMAAAAAAMSVAVHLGFEETVPTLRLGDHVVSYTRAGLIVVPSWVLLLGTQDAYSPIAPWVREQRLCVVRAGMALIALIAIAEMFLRTGLPPDLAFAVVALTVAFTLTFRSAARRAHRGRRWVCRAVVVGSRSDARALARQLGAQPSTGIEIVGSCVGDPTDTDAMARDVLAIVSGTGADLVAVTSGTLSPGLPSLAWALEAVGVDLVVPPAVVDVTRSHVSGLRLGGLPFARVVGCHLTGVRLVAKELIDRVGAALLILGLAPLLAAVGLAIKATSRGPVLFRQQRVGRDGHPFSFLKFRTMVVDADARLPGLSGLNACDGLLFKIPDDPRVTPIGRVLRRASLDELPQLWNVVRGDMSLVGPRPLPIRPDQLAGAARRRLRVKPGITGLWQVSGRADLSWERTVELDQHYVDHWSLGLDLSILLRTPAAVVTCRGAY
jgi:exopolysaccharide biosynthesis polyprenyl glycosylphosphotransferase